MDPNAVVETLISEVARTAGAHVTSAGVAGARRVFRLVRNQVGTDDAEKFGELLRARVREDPELLGRLAEVLAEEASGSSGALSPPEAPFFDRDGVRAGVPRSGVRIFSGQYGIGKTALVRQVADDLRARFADVVYVDVAEHRDGQVVEPATVQLEVLRKLGVRDVVADTPGIQEQYARVTARRRLLLVLENVRGSAELEALLPVSPISLTLVTTETLTEDLLLRYSAEACVELPGLDHDGAWELLASKCGRHVPDAEPAETARLLRLCDFLPFAVAQFGVELRRRDHESRPVAGLLTRLHRDGVHAGELAAQFLAVTFAGLSESTAVACGVLAGHPGWGDFTARSADALLGYASRPVLDELDAAGLLVRSPGGRYRLHHLTREYALGVAARSSVDLDAAFERILGFFRDDVVAADLAHGQDRLRCYRVPDVPAWSGDQAPADWLEAERDVLADLVRRAHDAGRHEEVTQLCAGFELLSLHRGYHRLCEFVYERGIRSAEQLDDPGLHARLRSLRGRLHTLMHEFAAAEADLTRASELVLAVDDRRLESSVLEFWGRFYEERADVRGRADYSAAVAAFTESVRLDRIAGDSRALGLHTRMLANADTKDGSAESALPWLDEALENTREDRNLSRVHTVRAKAHAALHQLAEAKSAVARARALADRAGATQYDAELRDIEARIAFLEGEFGVARSLWGALVQECLTSGHPKVRIYLDRLNQLPPV